jgi:hypothetical protein
MDAIPHHVCKGFYAMMPPSGDTYASRGLQNRLLSVNHQFNRPTCQDGQVAVLVYVLNQPAIGGNAGFLGVYAAGKMMFDHVTSLPLTRILMALAVLAIVEMNAPDCKMWPTNSGKM